MISLDTNLTEIIFLLDRSGSMSGLEMDTIGGFNSFVEKQSQQSGETTLSAVLFDDDYEVLWDVVDAKKVRLTDQDYFVRGSTALLDAVGKTIVDVGQRLSNTKAEQRPEKLIFVITTDGMENSSREFTHQKVKHLINHQQEKYNWEFIFLGANMDAAQEADSLGISSDHAFNFEASNKGVEDMYEMVNEVVLEKRQIGKTRK
ncbi:vWA domain-containing protein [Aquibacillus saliphilus]|uniref:vWA domain-containing protein n=1 Tax=Aquibacillus saliphilus TaxID=1909422 RepID=UPI001CF00B4C|nr:vWA domain-containing protein [Aquibacillus saliphilus]